jgi:ABC-type uncharacterized transport system substrate-binding protein
MGGPLVARHKREPALEGPHRAVTTRILSGARPAELPIEPPAMFELVLNLRATDAIGFTFPPSMVAKAATVLP